MSSHYLNDSSMLTSINNVTCMCRKYERRWPGIYVRVRVAMPLQGQPDAGGDADGSEGADVQHGDGRAHGRRPSRGVW